MAKEDTFWLKLLPLLWLGWIAFKALAERWAARQRETEQVAFERQYELLGPSSETSLIQRLGGLVETAHSYYGLIILALGFLTFLSGWNMTILGGAGLLLLLLVIEARRGKKRETSSSWDEQGAAE